MYNLNSRKEIVENEIVEGAGGAVQTSEVDVGEGGVGPECVRDVCRPLVRDAAVPRRARV